MSVTDAAAATFGYLSSRLHDLGRWLDAVLSEFPLDDFEARCLAEHDGVVPSRDF